MSYTTLDETQIKELFKQAFVELLQERKELLYELFVEVIEDFALLRYRYLRSVLAPKGYLQALPVAGGAGRRLGK